MPFSHLVATAGDGPTGPFRNDVFCKSAGGGPPIRWLKPPGASMVFMLTISGGGGGGAGFTRTVGNAGGGGGGGAQSPIANFSCPAIFLPDVLYVTVGAGGAGGIPGVSSGNGGAGGASYVSFSTTNVLPNLVCYSAGSTTAAGGGGATGAAGTGGGAPTIPVTQPINALGVWQAITGAAGANGGIQSGQNGGSVTPWTNTLSTLSPGAGGGGGSADYFTGGSVYTGVTVDFGSFGLYDASNVPNMAKGGDSAAGPVNGETWRGLWKPFLQAGGAGGALKNAGVGGNGGNGGIGCGGGGGGAGATAGNGGPGGDGLVLIISW